LTAIAEHLDRCGIAVGSVELVESLREAIGDYSATRFVCPTVTRDSQFHGHANQQQILLNLDRRRSIESQKRGV
jgi:hypothetical protein